MALSPLDIKNKTFPVKMRGYNPEEVDDFIDQVITDYEDSLTDRRELEKALKHSEEKLAYFNELKDALNQSIIVAQDTADKVKESAVRESDLLVTTAEANAKEIVAQANAQAEQKIKEASRQAKEIMNIAAEKASVMSEKSDDLRKHTREFHRSLTLMLESQVEIVKSKDWQDLLNPKFSSEDLELETLADFSEVEEAAKFEEAIAPAPVLKEVEEDLEDDGDDEYEYYYEDDEEETTEEVAADVTDTLDIDQIIANAAEEIAALEPVIEPTIDVETLERVERKRRKRSEK